MTMQVAVCSTRQLGSDIPYCTGSHCKLLRLPDTMFAASSESSTIMLVVCGVVSRANFATNVCGGMGAYARLFEYG